MIETLQNVPHEVKLGNVETMDFMFHQRALRKDFHRNIDIVSETAASEMAQYLVRHVLEEARRKISIVLRINRLLDEQLRAGKDISIERFKQEGNRSGYFMLNAGDVHERVDFMSLETGFLEGYLPNSIPTHNNHKKNIEIRDGIRNALRGGREVVLKSPYSRLQGI